MGTTTPALLTSLKVAFVCAILPCVLVLIVSDKAKGGCTNYRIDLTESFIPEPGKNHRATGLGTHRKPRQAQDPTDHLAPIGLILTGSFSLWYHFQLES